MSRLATGRNIPSAPEEKRIRVTEPFYEMMVDTFGCEFDQLPWFC